MNPSKGLEILTEWSVFMCVCLWVVCVQLTMLTCSGSEPGLKSLLLLQLPEPPDRRRTDDDDWPMSAGTDTCRRVGKQVINFTNTHQSPVCILMLKRNMQWYLREAGAAPMQRGRWGAAEGSGTAGESPWVGALTVTHPGGETRPRGYWVVRASSIFHTELLWCTCSHTQGWMHTFLCPSSKKKILPYCLVPFFLLHRIKVFHIQQVYSGALVGVHAPQQTKRDYTSCQPGGLSG